MHRAIGSWWIEDDGRCMKAQAIPNFFIAGAPKAGTTSLYHHLSQHPDIFMSPVKEPCHFSLETRPENYVPELRARVQETMYARQAQARGNLDHGPTQGIVADRRDYLGLFDGRRHERAIGEASVHYLWSKTAAKGIAEFNPTAKIVVILRHPAERAFSEYLYHLANGHVSHCFSEHIVAGLKTDGKFSFVNPFLAFGSYGEQLERLFDHIPPQRVGVWLYEETLADPAKFFRELLTFLGVDADFVPDRSRRYLQMAVPKAVGMTQMLQRCGVWPLLRACTPARIKPMVKKLIYKPRASLVMRPEDRRFLIEYYRDDVRRLERVIERDLSAWMQ